LWVEHVPDATCQFAVARLEDDEHVDEFFMIRKKKSGA
jgi:hypothetical protein